MNILQVVPYFYPAWAYGGPAKLVFDISKYFASKGENVTVYTSDSFDIKKRMPKSKYITGILNLRVFYFKNINNKLAYLFNIFITPGFFIWSLKDFYKFDVIHLHDFYTLQNVWVSFLARFYNKPYVLSVHGCLEEKRLAQRSFFKRLFLKIFGKDLLKNASKVIATSPNEAKAYMNCGVPKSKIVLFGHGVDPEEFTTKLSKTICKKRLGLKKDCLVITYLGRIHRIKGLDLLVKAIASIDNPKIQYIIAGSDDGYLKTLQEEIKKNNLQKRIKLLGTCFGEEKSQLFKASDVFVYPSYSEGFSLGILEAAAVGLPLIITRGCHFDQVEKYGAGIIVESKSEEIVEAINLMVEDNKRRDEAGINAKRLINECYSMELIGNKYLKVYTSVKKN